MTAVLAKNHVVSIPAGGGSGGVHVASPIPQAFEAVRFKDNHKSLSPYDKVQISLRQHRREVSKNKLKKVLLDLDREDIAQ